MVDITPLLGLFFAIMGNYVAQTLPCSTRRLLASPFAKFALVWILLVMSISYTNGEKSFPEAVRSSVPVFVLFVLATIVDAPYLIAAFALLLVGLVLGTELKQGRIPDPVAARRAKIAAQACNATAAAVLVVGATLYYRRQRVDHARDWSWLRFFSLKCRRVRA